VSAGREDRPPDLTQPVLGFRLWTLGSRGTLGAVAAGSIWSRGVNEAVCCPGVAPSKRPKHRSPHPGCVCGFNAYSTLHRKLTAYQGTALGVIAAWGELDVYRSGFRAEFAQVLALALPGRRKVSEPERARFELASRRYGVPLVSRRELEAEGLKHAAPVPASLHPQIGSRPAPSPATAQPAKPKRAPLTIATWRHARGSAIWVRRHVALRCRGDVVEVCPAPGATALLAPSPRIWASAVGERVRAGDVLATIESAYPGEFVHLRTPVDATVSALNPGFSAALLDGDPAVSVAPWLVDLRPDAAAPLDDAPLLWDRAGAELYRRSVMGRSDAEILAELAAGSDLSSRDLRPLEQAPASRGSMLPLSPHQLRRNATPPEQGSRAAITVQQLRPLLEGVGAAGPDDLLAA
jgi:hypothetical protein